MSKQKMFNSAPTSGTMSNITAADIAFELTTQIDAEFYDALYPERDWMKIVPAEQVMSDINPGATSYAYMMRNRHGAAAFIGHGPNNDIPMVGQSLGAVDVPIAYAAVGATVTNEDARQYSYGVNGNLASDLGEAMREASDNLIERTVIFGARDLGFAGWINYPGLTVMTPVAVGGKTQWEFKSPIEIVNDVNMALSFMWQRSRTIFKPTTIFLPLKQFSYITSTPMVIGATNTSSGTGIAVNIIDYLVKNNVMYRITGQELEVIPCRYLDGAGVGGQDRMVIMDRNKKNQCLPFPLPYSLSEPQPVNLGVSWFAENKIGSYHVRQQGSMAYVDGI